MGSVTPAIPGATTSSASQGYASNESTSLVLFGGGLLLGSCVALGTAWAVSRYYRVPHEAEERRPSRRRRGERPTSPLHNDLGGPASRRGTTSPPQSPRHASRSISREQQGVPARKSLHAPLPPNGAPFYKSDNGPAPASYANGSVNGGVNGGTPGYLGGPGSHTGSLADRIQDERGLETPPPPNFGRASTNAPSPIVVPSPTPWTHGTGITPMNASPRNAALMRCDTIDMFGPSSDNDNGSYRVSAAGGAGGRRDTEVGLEDLHPQISNLGLAGAAALAGLGPAPVAGVSQLAAAAGAPGAVPFFAPGAVPASDRSSKTSQELARTSTTTKLPGALLPNGNAGPSNQVASHPAPNKPPILPPIKTHAPGATAQQPNVPPPLQHHHPVIEKPPQSKFGDLAVALNDDYCRVITPEVAMTEETEEACAMLVECIELRKKWLFAPAQSPEARALEPEAAKPSEVGPPNYMFHALDPYEDGKMICRMVDGVMQVYEDEAAAEADPKTSLFPVPGTAAEFFTSMHRILRYAALGPVKSFCHHRLMLLEQKFNLHVMLNADKEFLSQKAAPHRDFYNVRKVDTHIHHSACMHQKHLLRFIKSKLRKEPDEVVIFRDGKYLTLKEVFESLNLTGYDLNVDTLDMHADKSLFHRFDRFNLKYNPCGQSRLREIFIKQDNLIHGRFLAELTQEVFSDLEASKYQHAEMRISIYGRKAMEWDILAAWVTTNQLYSDNNAWLIQIPRLYNVYKETGVIENFQQMLDNIFEPLFEVTRDPSTHPHLHLFLSHVVGFDMVDDESKPERRPTKHCPPPAEWNSKHNCAFSYYAYYIYANLYVLNKFREHRGLNTFALRPHAGEAGDIDHLASAFMLCENIAHGINLRKSPMLQYLFYLAQIGLCMSPLSNNSLFLDYHRNPFPQFFARGLSVSLSTDDPLQIHLTKEPLVEEYSVAAQVWKLSSADLCEIARNGVLHSGFPHACKKHWVGSEYWRPGPDGNDIHKTNVPNLRLRFRYDTYMDEMRLVAHGALAYDDRKKPAQRMW